jgi:hypothetical protein
VLWNMNHLRAPSYLPKSSAQHLRQSAKSVVLSESRKFLTLFLDRFASESSIGDCAYNMLFSVRQ